MLTFAVIVAHDDDAMQYGNRQDTPRHLRFMIKLSEAEMAQLDALAEVEETSRAAVVRRAIGQAYEQMRLDQAAKVTPP